MKPHTGILLGVVAALLVTTAIELAPPWIIRQAVDRFMLGEQTERIWWAAAGLLALSLVQGGIDFLRLYLTAYTGQRIVFDIRNAIFAHLSRLSFSFYDRARTGDLMSRVTADVDVLSNFFGRAAVIVLGNILTLIGILAILIVWDWRSVLPCRPFFSLMPRSAKTLPMAVPTPPKARSNGQRKGYRYTTLSSPSRWATARRLASEVYGSPAGRGSASPWPACC